MAEGWLTACCSTRGRLCLGNLCPPFCVIHGNTYTSTLHSNLCIAIAPPAADSSRDSCNRHRFLFLFLFLLVCSRVRASTPAALAPFCQQHMIGLLAPAATSPVSVSLNLNLNEIPHPQQQHHFCAPVASSLPVILSASPSRSRPLSLSLAASASLSIPPALRCQPLSVLSRVRVW